MIRIALLSCVSQAFRLRDDCAELNGQSNLVTLQTHNPTVAMIERINQYSVELQACGIPFVLMIDCRLDQKSLRYAPSGGFKLDCQGDGHPQFVRELNRELVSEHNIIMQTNNTHNASASAEYVNLHAYTKVFKIFDFDPWQASTTTSGEYDPWAAENYQQILSDKSLPHEIGPHDHHDAGMVLSTKGF